MSEQWRDIENYEGFYQVSNKGRVKSLSRIKKYANGGERLVPERILAAGYNSNRYRHVTLCGVVGQQHLTKKVSRLVANAFIPKVNGKPFVNHINGIRDDDRVENLEWVTASENQLHSYKFLGKSETLPRGEKRRNSKLKQGQVVEILKIWEAGETSQPEIARKYNISQSTVSEIVNRKYWKQLKTE